MYINSTKIEIFNMQYCNKLRIFSAEETLINKLDFHQDNVLE